MSATRERTDHWETIYSTKAPGSASWYQSVPQTSLDLVARAGATAQSRIIDVGCGASNLADHLIARGITELTLLDVSDAALAHTRRRLGAAPAELRWIAGDALTAPLGDPFDVWHDRAVFHFLTAARDRRRYVDRMHGALVAGGHGIIATFAEDGPERCSGLAVMRYSPEKLHGELGQDRFTLIESRRETHVTPQGKEQRFQYCLLQKR